MRGSWKQEVVCGVMRQVLTKSGRGPGMNSLSNDIGVN